ncbi:hypothetical protein DACRYDRAFT_21365 [Dacryopinax primogenitus]|uniref:Uncharacterized protein n=1 Tax=Dacryopinax primogenitus (strain DJM 731) TaxID=1858805 RepID=M5G460_DACPD|nr:uncharacterized protein DACRYDRAFT_21365 [Dacryopinax primogenitus]EJU03000.1 hypothetical protein DACRYDRAFT_21365 [Dacryopinax primogenitus]
MEVNDVQKHYGKGTGMNPPFTDFQISGGWFDYAVCFTEKIPSGKQPRSMAPIISI